MKNLNLSRVKIAALFTILSLLSFVSFAQNDSTSVAHVGFVYPISSNGQRAGEITNAFSLHAIAGLSKYETAFTLSGVASIIKKDAKGFQIAGSVNAIGGSANGAQIAGALNLIGGNAGGAQVAAFANMIRGDVTGAQIAGFMNLTGAPNAGQIAGFTNISTRDGNGFQVAGFLNKAKNVNSQIAGFANVAKKVKGVQLAGLINIADSSDYPIALFNFIKNGEKSISLSVDETLTGMATFRSGGRVLYGIAGVGYNLQNNKEPLYGVEAGFGAHIDLAGPFRINLEEVTQTLTDFQGSSYFKNSLRILPTYKVGNAFEVFAGPTVNYICYDREDDYGFIKKFIWKNTGTKDFQGLYIGFNAGVAARF